MSQYIVYPMHIFSHSKCAENYCLKEKKNGWTDESSSILKCIYKAITLDLILEST